MSAVAATEAQPQTSDGSGSMHEEKQDLHKRQGSNDDKPTSPRFSDFHRSASYTYLPQAKDSAYGSVISLPISVESSVSEHDLVAQYDSTDASFRDSSGCTTPHEEPEEQESHIKHATTLVRVPQASQEASTPRPPTFEDDVERLAITETKETPTESRADARPNSSTVPKVQSQASALARRLSRKIVSRTPSRSPSPTKKDSTLRQRIQPTSAPAHGVTDSSSPVDALGLPQFPPPSKPSRKGTLLRRKTKPKGTSHDVHDVPQYPPNLVHQSFSTDKLPTLRTSTEKDFRQVPVPRIVTDDKTSTLSSLSLPRKKDELWSVFRSLEADYAKFSSKSTSLKANVVRSSLLAFLRNYANHPSNRNLRPEDLDRRTTILGKWWTGLLDMLSGKNNQSISGIDRPTVLDALSGLMDRPEWRPVNSSYCPLDARTKHEHSTIPRQKSYTSIASTNDFLVESVLHNVRNAFIQNLTAQMTFVVDKMSLRSASASLVTFCGKATAYAFYFCPGIADVLVRLWATPSDTLKRVLSEYGIDKYDKADDTAAGIIASFPPPMASLGFTSLPKMLRSLKQPASLPIGAAHIEWYGFWTERWLGRESDLFYVFVKWFHILAADYLPPDASIKERACAPGMLLVHSQILSNLDSTVHRDAVQADATASSNITFDDMLDPDAVASTLPLPPANAVRIMAENRLIMLVRDFLSERAAVDHPRAQLLFAQAFNSLLHACAKKISVFDHAACYTLCEFLEEALLIMVRYEHIDSSKANLIDSAFWVHVWKSMISSHNTMTEIRLYAFLYSVWTIVCSDPKRKADLCQGLLLDREIFERTFSHWCPMVRAYYMRLMCWRVGRFDGDASDQDIRMYETFHQRLRLVWALYLSSRDESDLTHSPPIPTAPCNPAPGRRFIIMRTDTQPAPGGSFLAFNGNMPSTPTTRMDGFSDQLKQSSTTSSPANSRIYSVESPDVDEESERVSGLRGFLKGIMGTSRRRSKSRSSSIRDFSESPTPSPPNGRVVRTDGAETPRSRAAASKSPNRPEQTHRTFCFKFSLEFNTKLTANPPGNMRLLPPRLPMAAQHLVQSRHPGAVSPLRKPPIGHGDAQKKYVGRALAEWNIVVGECQAFIDRRKAEGAPDDRWVETPALGVEMLRR